MNLGCEVVSLVKEESCSGAFYAGGRWGRKQVGGLGAHGSDAAMHRRSR